MLFGICLGWFDSIVLVFLYCCLSWWIRFGVGSLGVKFACTFAFRNVILSCACSV